MLWRFFPFDFWIFAVRSLPLSFSLRVEGPNIFKGRKKISCCLLCIFLTADIVWTLFYLKFHMLGFLFVIRFFGHFFSVKYSFLFLSYSLNLSSLIFEYVVLCDAAILIFRWYCFGLLAYRKSAQNNANHSFIFIVIHWSVFIAFFSISIIVSMIEQFLDVFEFQANTKNTHFSLLITCAHNETYSWQYWRTVETYNEP